jgi:hypothetical protein
VRINVPGKPMKPKATSPRDRATSEQKLLKQALMDTNHACSIAAQTERRSFASSLRWEEMDWFKKWERVARHEA